MVLRWPALTLALGALLLATTGALLAARLLAPPPRLVDLGAPGDAYLVASFYQPERAGATSFRWSGPNSALLIPAHAADRLILSARLHGAAPDQQLTLGAPAAPAPATIRPSDGWRVYHLLTAAPAAPHALVLSAYPTLPAQGDPRELGVAVDWVRLEPLPRGAGALPGALGAAALLIWGLALVGGALWAARPAGVAAPAGAWAALGLTASAAAALALWAWRDIDSLRWLLPLRPAPLAAATLAIAAVGLVRLPPLARAADGRRRRLRALAWLAATLGVAHALLWLPAPMAWRGAAALAILWAPGWLATALLLRQERDAAMGLALRLAGALTGQVLLLMAAAALPWGAAGWPTLLLCDATSAALAAALLRSDARPLSLSPRGRARLAPWLAVLLLAAALRLPALGAAELHDDEASVLLAAAEVAQGRPDVLLAQLKGPAQILLPAGPLALTGQLSELTARLPFAVAGLAVVLAGMSLARRMVGPGAPPIVAGLLLALDGLLIAFARIVQYQSAVMLLSAAACWCCWRFARGAPGPRRYLAAAALFTAAALLGHYDAIYVLPALLALVVAGARRRGWGPATTARAVAWPAAIGAAALASFYVPFALHPHFAETLRHLGERTGQQGGGGRIYNNLAASYSLMSAYNAPAQVWAGAALIVTLVIALLLRAGPARPRLALAALALAGGLWLTSGPTAAWLGGSGPLALTVAALALGAAAFTPATGPTLRATLLWFAAAWLSMVFLIAQPRTHIYVMVVPGALLAAAGAARLARARLAPALRGALAAVALLAALWSGLHQQVVYLRQSPEYQRAYPQARLAPLPAGPDELPLDLAARFGFPARDGWKAIGELYRRGELRGAVASNQSSEVVAWYMRGQRRCNAEPELYLIALAAPNPAIPAGYYRAGAVQVDGRDQILIYQRTAPAGPARVVPLEAYTDAFDERVIPPMPAYNSPCG